MDISKLSDLKLSEIGNVLFDKNNNFSNKELQLILALVIHKLTNYEYDLEKTKERIKDYLDSVSQSDSYINDIEDNVKDILQKE